jgi:Tol biopolymer transport system component
MSTTCLRCATALTLLALTAFATSAQTADATLPARNGRLAFTRTLTWDDGCGYASSDRLMSVLSNGRRSRYLTPEGDATTPAFSPDGTRLAYAEAGRLEVMPAGGGTARRLLDAISLREPSWSPSGDRLAFDFETYKDLGDSYDSWSGIATINSDGTKFHKLIENGSSADWSSRGDIVYKDRRDRILVRRRDGRTLHTGALGDGPAWSPDGLHIAFVRSHTDKHFNDTSHIWIMDANGSNQRRLTTSRRLDSEPAWSPDGKKIAFSRGHSIYTIGTWGWALRRIASPGKPPKGWDLMVYGEPAWQPMPRPLAAMAELTSATAAFDRPPAHAAC